MAELELITGHTGEQHVLAIDDAEIYRTLLGNGDFILSTGHKFEARMNGANKVDIYDGTAIIQGRQMKIRSGYQELNTEGGVTGYRREDAVVLEYSKSGDIETAELKVIKGANNASAYKPPTLIQGNIDEGQTRQVRLWGVRYNGINFDSLIDYRTILDTTPIQTALDTATAAKAQITADLESYKQTLTAEMVEYQEDTYDRLNALASVVRVAPLTTVVGHNLKPSGIAVYTKEFTRGSFPKEWSISGLGFARGDAVRGIYYIDKGPIDEAREETWCTYGSAVDNATYVYDGENSFYFKETSSNANIVEVSVYKGGSISVPAPSYTYSSNDVFIAYINGLKLPTDQYTVTYNNGNLIISSEVLFSGRYYDDVEIEVWRPEEA